MPFWKGICMNINLQKSVVLISLLAGIVSAQERLTISGKEILHNGTPVELRGINVVGSIGKIGESDVQAMDDMGFNFVRLLVDIDDQMDLEDTEGDGDYLKQQAVTDWKTMVHRFAEHKIWVHVEMRTNTYDLPTTELWTVGSPLHTKWIAMWKKLVTELHTEDYIAMWGILAEHSQGKRSMVKSVFQPVMEAIDAIDGKTPFSFGPKLNSIDVYDTATVKDWYWSEYENRIVYQINHLHPKPYINKDTTKGYNPETWWYHRIDGQDGEGSDNDDAMHKQGTLNHLSKGLAWRDFYNAPIYIDQWGCDYNQPGFLDYERDMLEIFKEQNLPNARWTYYQGNGRGIMTQNADSAWVLHAGLTDFFTSAYKNGQPWPTEIAVSEPNAGDNHITTEAVSTTLPWSIDFRFDSAFACNKVELFSGNDPQAFPTAGDLLGSNDSVTWNPIGTASSINFAGTRTMWNSPVWNNTTAYKYYRFTITSGGSTSTAVSNVEFYPAPKSENGTVAVVPSIQKSAVQKIGLIPNGNGVSISGISAGTTIKLYSLNGRELSRIVSGGAIANLTVPSAGVFVVKAGNWSGKIVR